MALLTQNFKSKLNSEAITFDKMGLYIFGGLNELKEPTNDLYFIKPCNKETNDVYDSRTGDFIEDIEPRVYFEIRKIEADGLPPTPRFLHCAQHISKYLCIFGGKNDELFTKLRNTALNDLHLYDIELKNWKTVAIYGYLPMSRWGHCSTAYQNQMIIFGGKNLDRYAHGNR